VCVCVCVCVCPSSDLWEAGNPLTVSGDDDDAKGDDDDDDEDDDEDEMFSGLIHWPEHHHCVCESVCV